MYFEVWCSFQSNSLKDFWGSSPPLAVSAKKLHFTSNNSITSPAVILWLRLPCSPPQAARPAGIGSGTEGTLLLLVTLAQGMQADARCPPRKVKPLQGPALFFTALSAMFGSRNSGGVCLTSCGSPDLLLTPQWPVATVGLRAPHKAVHSKSLLFSVSPSPKPLQPALGLSCYLSPLFLPFPSVLLQFFSLLVST